jgi:protein-tyrosine phosphatase
VSTRRVGILVVCTGNICRSPLAAQLLNARLNNVAETALFRVSSSGTAALDGAPMTPEAEAWSRRLGGDPTGHRARSFEPDQARAADLVLGLTREHRAWVVEQVPDAVARSFTLVEFARLVGDLRRSGYPVGSGIESPGGFVELVAAAGRGRGSAPPPHPADLDDIVDPYRRSSAVYERAALGIDAAVRVLERALTRPPVAR